MKFSRRSYWRNQNRTYEWREITTRSREVERSSISTLCRNLSNIQKRNAKRKTRCCKISQSKSQQNLLNVIDNLESNASPSESEEAQNLKKRGWDGVWRFPFMHCVKKALKMILNQPFDPTLHHAVQTVPLKGQGRPRGTSVSAKAMELKRSHTTSQSNGHRITIRRRNFQYYK